MIGTITNGAITAVIAIALPILTLIFILYVREMDAWDAMNKSW